MEMNTNRDRLRTIVENRLATTTEMFVPGKTPIPLSVPTFGVEEILEALDSLLAREVTMGKKVMRFERLFADYIGVKHAIMVNSGSSANLVALSVLGSKFLDKVIKPGDEVIVPAVAWSTTIFPILNIGAVPVFVDVELATFNLDTRLIRNAISPKTRAILPVHLLGNPCDMRAINEISAEYALHVIEDACEAPGADIAGKKVGSFGSFGTFSFYFSHHISTIEGGMVVTNDPLYADLARSIRAHGWIRERTDRDSLAAKHSGLDRRFLFVSPGYNLRPTEIQGSFGIQQLPKLESLIRLREQNADFWTRKLAKFSDFLDLPQVRTGYRHVFFGYPITIKSDAPFTRDELATYLEAKGIENRPIMAGDFTQQPVFASISSRISGNLTNARQIHTQSLLWGNHQGIDHERREFIVDCIETFIDGKRP